MKKITVVLIVCMISASLVSCNKKNQYQSFIDEGIFESVDTNFKSVNNSFYFIKKYKLTSDEINNIGSWFVDTYNNQYIENSGLGISIAFYPNRMFRVYKDHAGLNDIQYIFGDWKIENKKLLISLKIKAVKLGNNTWDFETTSNHNYYKILKIKKYNSAVINSEAYDFTSVPQNIKKYFEINENDLPRYRLLFDTLGNPPGDLTADSKYEQIFSSVSFDKDYLKQLIEVW